MRFLCRQKKRFLNNTLYLLAVFGLTAITASCGGNKNNQTAASGISSEAAAISSANNSSASSYPPITETPPSEKAHWKRVKAIKHDLAYALDLNEDELCHELGSLSCFDQVHLSALGGNEPFILTQYEPIESPSAISAVVTERVVLAACSNKVDIDQQSTATVFTQYDLSAMAEPRNNDYLAALDLQNTLLYQRLLARDPTQEELTLLQELTQDTQGNAISNADVAKLSCFTIATSSEFIFL